MGKTCKLSTVEDMKNGIIAVLSNFLIPKPTTAESADNIENAILLNRWMNKNPLPDVFSLLSLYVNRKKF